MKKKDKSDSVRNKEFQLQQDADRLVQREVGHNLTALVEECFKKEIFQYDDIVNFYHYRVDNKITGWEEYMSEQRLGEHKKEIQGKINEIEGDSSFEGNVEMEKIRDEWQGRLDLLDDVESEPQEIFEWWIVSDWLAEKLEERGEPILKADDYWLTLWGRTTSGQSISMDGVIRDITREIHKADCGGSMKMERGGTALDREMRDDIAWDIGIEQQFIEDNEWKNDDVKNKAYKLADLELLKYHKGGKAGAKIDTEINWLITGKS